MQHSNYRRKLLGATATSAFLLLTVTTGSASAAASPPSRTAAPVPAAVGAAQSVIVVLKNQHTDLPITKGKASPRTEQAERDQAPVIALAERVGARKVHGFKALNGFAAVVNSTQLADIAADPTVAAVYPDLQISKPTTVAAGAAATAPAAPPASVCPTDPAKPLLEPEALQLTNTAFLTKTTPQAQNLVTGRGVKVAFLADGVDINNPDFIRADGTHVFTDYQDFSGEGPDAPSSAAEAFGDASSIGAQGRQVYDLSSYVNAAHPLPAGCNITIRGVAPGASLVGLKVFGNAPSAPTSRFIEAIDYAVNVAGVDVINESFGGNPFPDNGNDPITLADNAAVDAGVTVVASTGDAGTSGTIGSPASGSKIIGVAATTSFQSYIQETGGGAQFSNGTWASNNISGLSSGGITQGNKQPDLAAPGDLGWALCSPNTDIYLDCTDDNGNPSPIQNFGGTSQSSPLTAGAAALVIEAYEHTHHGDRPAPALVKRLLTSTATDLGHPAYEQGAGLLNSLAAVKAAMSWKDANGSPTPQGTALVVDKTQLSVTGAPGSTSKQSLTVRNVSRNTQTVNLTTRTIGRTLSSTTGSLQLNTATAPTYLDAYGIARSYVKKTFTVPIGAKRLDASIAVTSPKGAPRIILIDPHGTFTAYSIPQGSGNYSHIDAHYPAFGTWTAYFAVPAASGLDAPVKYAITTSAFATDGSVSPARVTLAPGASRTVTVTVPLPAQPGDLSSSVQLTTALGLTTSVPVAARAVVPAASTTFQGVITGGNGRNGTGLNASANSYYLDVPAGKRDLGIGFTLNTDPNVAVQGVLTAPDGQVYSYTTNQTDAANNAGFQIYRRDPQAGRWVLSIVPLNPATGLEIQQHFTVRVAYNTVQVTASGLPDNGAALTAGKTVTIPVRVKNTGVAPLTYFADGRLTKTGDIPLAELTGNSTNLPLPVPAGVYPEWLVPTDSTSATFAASASQPVNLDVFYASGEPEDYAAAQGNGAIVQVAARQVSPGLWLADVGQVGPFAGPAPAGTVSVAASVHAQLFDPAVTSSTGDVWLAGVDSGTDPAIAALLHASHPAVVGAKGGVTIDRVSAADAAPAPVTIAPGATGTILVKVTPKGTKGSTVTGHVYIDTFNLATFSGDELVALPYSYKIG